MVKKKPPDEKPARQGAGPGLRISAAAREAGVSRQTVEYYVMIGLIAPRRVSGRHGRFFDEPLVRRIRLIRRMNRLGYTLGEIRRTYRRRLEGGKEG